MTIPQATKDLITNALVRFGITNAFVQTAILSSIASETSFVPKNEDSYRNTPNDRIRSIFTTRVSMYNEDQLTDLKKDDAKFFEAVYGYQTTVGRNNGNTRPGDGYRYIGRGFNQITFYNNYKRIGDLIGVDLIANPAKLNELPTAALAAAAYFAESFRIAKANGTMLRKVGITDINQVKDRDTAVRLVLQSNAGWGSNIDAGFLATIQQKQRQLFDLIAQNPGTSATSLLILIGLFFLGYKFLVSDSKD